MVMVEPKVAYFFGCPKSSKIQNCQKSKIVCISFWDVIAINRLGCWVKFIQDTSAKLKELAGTKPRGFFKGEVKNSVKIQCATGFKMLREFVRCLL